MQTNTLRLSTLFALSCLAGTVQADTLIDTYPTGPLTDGRNFFAPFGRPNVTTYGQTFTVPTGNTNLASFGLSLRYRSGDTSNFQFYVAPWGGDRISAAPLYSSPVVTTPVVADDLKDYVFTPKVNLTAGVKYVAFISTVDLPGGNGASDLYGAGTFDANSLNPYAGGGFVLTSGPNTSSTWTSDAWYTGLEARNDIAFRANFVAAVPEPGQIALLFGMGVTGLSLIARRRALLR